MKPVTVARARIIYGSATCGKTTAIAMLRARGLRVMDTDEITAVYTPGWFSMSTDPRTTKQQWEDNDRRIAELTARYLSVGDDTVVITNRWGGAFLAALPSELLTNGRIPVGAIRTNPAEVKRISIARGGPPVSEEKAIERYGPEAFERIQAAVNRLIVLGDGQYLTDALRFAYPWLSNAMPEVPRRSEPPPPRREARFYPIGSGDRHLLLKQGLPNGSGHEAMVLATESAGWFEEYTSGYASGIEWSVRDEPAPEAGWWSDGLRVFSFHLKGELLAFETQNFPPDDGAPEIYPLAHATEE